MLFFVTSTMQYETVRSTIIVQFVCVMYKGGEASVVPAACSTNPHNVSA